MSLFFLASKDRKYDANGNNTSQSEVDKYLWSYNDANRMSEFKVGSTIRGQYYHNAIGQRVHKSQYKTNGTLAGEFLFVYDEQGQLVHVSRYKNGEHKWDRETIWLGNRPVARVETKYSAGAVTSQNIYYIQTDHLNTPRWITDDIGTRIWSWESDAFGSTAPDMDVDGDGVNFYFYMRFPGQYFDVESGLHYNYFRDYEPGVGRYVESDPIGLGGGRNTFIYTMSSPLMYFDPLGLEIHGTWAIRPNLNNFSVNSSISNVIVGGTLVEISYSLNAAIKLTYGLDCWDDCSNEKWGRNYNVPITGSISGGVSVPYWCGIIPGLMKRSGFFAKRYVGAASAGCNAALTINLGSAINNATGKILDFLNNNGLEIVNYLLVTGPTELCKRMSR